MILPSEEMKTEWVTSGLFLFFSVFTNVKKFLQQKMWKLAILCAGMGFKLTIRWTWVSSHNHKIRDHRTNKNFFFSNDCSFIILTRI